MPTSTRGAHREGGREASPSTVPLIGREREVAELRAALDAALAGDGRVVLLAGEPGIGKTRLASALAGEAASRGVPVWSGRGFEDGSAPAFWSWNTALRRWVDKRGYEAVVAAAGSWGPELAHVFPVLRDRIAAPPASTTAEWDRARFRVFDIVSRFLAAFAAPAGLVVLLDDLHWADLPSLKLLEFVAADVHDTRLLVVAAYRDTEVQREDPFSETLSRLVREPSTRRLLVNGLSPADCARWVGLTGVEGDAAPLGEALHRETNGNPFFVGEVVHLLADEGSLRTGFSPERVPHGAREVIGRRLDRLGSDCRAVLDVAALFSDTIDARLLEEVLDDPTAADHLARAQRDRILVEVDGQRRQYAFAHALLRRVLADEQTPSERSAWHARIAVVLERQAVTAEEVTTELVRHFAAAGTPAALRKAFDYACQGAQQAARELGWEEAVRLYEIALDVGARSGAVDAERAIELELELARALRGAGDIPAARAHCEAVMTTCRSTGRSALLVRAALIHVGPTPQFGRVVPAERAVLEEALRCAGDVDDGSKARLHARLAADLFAANETEQAERVLDLCDEAARAARRAGDAGALAMALLGTYYAAALRLRPRDFREGRRSVPTAEEILAAAEAGGEHEISAAIRHMRAAFLFAFGEVDAFSAEVDALATAATASRVPEALWLADTLAALRSIVEGRFDEGHELMDRALATGQRMRLPNAIGQYSSQRIMWHFARGRLADVADEIDAFVREDPGGTGWEPSRALARHARGDLAGARTEWRTLLAAGFGAAESGIMSRCYLASLALLCVELGDRDSARELYERVLRRREAWIIDGCQTFGPWALVRGQLALLCEQPKDALDHFEEAIAVSRRMRAHPFLADAQARLAEVQLALDPRVGGDERFAALLDEAERSAAELDLAHVAKRVERLRARIGGRARSVPNAFRWDGEVWSVSFQDREIRLRDGKGPRYLATLLAAPGLEIHVLELAGGPAEPTPPSAVPDDLTIGGPGGKVDDAPDARAAQEYRAHVDELRAELDEAEGRGDLGRAERIRGQLDHLVSQLAQRFGTRARTRGPAETARKAVTKVLRTQIDKLLEAHPALGEHLRDSVRTGIFCSYAPATPTTWEVSFASSRPRG
jgi:tetratricopeptide (TPR) repeat protein